MKESCRLSHYKLEPQATKADDGRFGAGTPAHYKMSDEHSKLWRLGPTISLALLAGACYFKIPEVRNAVDARFPYFKEKLAECGYQLNPIQQELQQPQPSRLRSKSKDVVISQSTPPPVVEILPPTPAPQATPSVKQPVDLLTKLGPNRNQWPKTVIIKRLTLFPAVVNGKPTGNQYAKPGAEATLVTIRDGKLGLEYNGGGAWVPPEETDLAERVRQVQ